MGEVAQKTIGTQMHNKKESLFLKNRNTQSRSQLRLVCLFVREVNYKNQHFRDAQTHTHAYLEVEGQASERQKENETDWPWLVGCFRFPFRMY